MAEPNVTVAWHSLIPGDQLLRDGVVEYTILTPPFENQGIVGYRVKNRSGKAEIVTMSDRDRLVPVRRMV